MRSLKLLVSVVLVTAMALTSALVAQPPPFHGISFLKGAESPVEVGDPYQAAYLISNTVDTAQDTLVVKSLVDTVHAAAGDVVSGNILNTVTWNLSGGAFFNASNHLVLPFGASAVSDPYSFYNVVAGDFFLPDHVLVDTAVITWNDTCSSGASNCNTLDRTSNTVSLKLRGFTISLSAINPCAAKNMYLLLQSALPISDIKGNLDYPVMAG